MHSTGIVLCTFHISGNKGTMKTAHTCAAYQPRVSMSMCVVFHNCSKVLSYQLKVKFPKMAVVNILFLSHIQITAPTVLPSRHNQSTNGSVCGVFVKGKTRVSVSCPDVLLWQKDMFSKGFSYSDRILQYLKKNVSRHLLIVVGKSLG